MNNEWLNPLTGRMGPNGPGNPHGVPYAAPLRIGNNDTLRNDSSMGREKTIIAPVTCVPQGSENLVVSLGVSDVVFNGAAPPGTLYVANIVANIRFGIAGAYQSLDIDCKAGVQLSLMADALEVTARIENHLDAGSPVSVKVSASVSSGGRAARSFPTRTYPRTLVDPSANFLVPNFAYSLILMGDPDLFVSGAADVVISGTNASVGYSAGAPLATLQASQLLGAEITDGFKLPNGAAVVSIINNTGEPLYAVPVFALSV